MKRKFVMKRFLIITFVYFFSVWFFSCVVFAQDLACPTCPVISPIEDPANVVEVDSMPSGKAACRVRAGGGCGSGSVVGHWNGGSLIMTNAHVAGTRVGRSVTVDAVVDGVTVSKPARVVMAAYSDRTLTDWAVLHVPDWTAIEPVKMSREKPSGSHYTKGSPRCVWPLVSTDVSTADISDSSPLWRWRPNAIGGQSGSGVWSDDDNLQKGLLTWSWGGLGAGQQTSEIFRQASERSVSGEPRIAGLTDVGGGAVACENGFFAEANVTELPIWSDGQDEPADPDTPSLTAKEAELLATLKRRSAELGIDYADALTMLIGADCNAADGEMVGQLRVQCKERGIDFVRLVQLILELLELFR